MAKSNRPGYVTTVRAQEGLTQLGPNTTAHHAGYMTLVVFDDGNTRTGVLHEPSDPGFFTDDYEHEWDSLVRIAFRNGLVIPEDDPASEYFGVTTHLLEPVPA